MTPTEQVDALIEMHQMHLDQPETATPESQQEMMDKLVELKASMDGKIPTPEEAMKMPTKELRAKLPVVDEERA